MRNKKFCIIEKILQEMQKGFKKINNTSQEIFFILIKQKMNNYIFSYF